MPQIHVTTHDDAEIFLLDGALRLVRRAVAELKEDFPSGLYKVRVERGGAVREQIVSLEGSPLGIDLRVESYPAVAPIGPMFPDSRQGIEGLAQEALGAVAGGDQPLLIMCHRPAGGPQDGRPFAGVRLFPWRDSASAVDLGRLDYPTRVLGDREWAAVAVPVRRGLRTYLLEMQAARSAMRQSVLLADGWKTRVFIRGGAQADHAAQAPDQQRPASRSMEPDRLEVSIQMAAPWQQWVVYDDHLETVETARIALDNGRPIFVTEHLITSLLHNKYENPIAGFIGLHLFLNAVDWRVGKGKSPDLPEITGLRGRSPQDFAREVLGNLANLLQLEASRTPPADILALQARAGLLEGGRQRVGAPPMFWASWDALRAAAGPEGKVTIGRDIWQSAGDGAPAGPYLAWSPKRQSVDRTLDGAMMKYQSFVSEWLREDEVRAAPSREQLAEALGVPYSAAWPKRLSRSG